MCDYSLHGIRNRLAKEDEVLLVHRFYTGSKGLTSPEYLEPAARPKGRAGSAKEDGCRPAPGMCGVRSRRGKARAPRHFAKAARSAWFELGRSGHIPSAFRGSPNVPRRRRVQKRR
jgi:hypothetical protein